MIIGKVALVLALLGGIAFCVLKLIEVLFPGRSIAARVIEVMGKKAHDRISGTLEKGSRLVSQGEDILDGLEHFLDSSFTKSPQFRGKNGKEVIEKARGLLGHVKEFVNSPSALTSEPVLKFLLSTISPERQPLFRDFRDGKIYVITDDPDQPFQITPVIAQTASKIVSGISSSEGKARAIFRWMVDSVEYGRSKCRKGYRTSAEVFNDREGVCGEMAILYVVMARSVGLDSNFVDVNKDHRGEYVTHACASVRLNGRNVLVDPSYNRFDVRHMEYKILPDSKAIHYFKSVRRP